MSYVGVLDAHAAESRASVNAPSTFEPNKILIIYGFIVSIHVLVIGCDVYYVLGHGMFA
jgi:hypothetical protein